MNISKYETFIATIETGSLTQAAENLGCTQSAVSHSIASLEADLGFPLITRSRGGVRLSCRPSRRAPGCARSRA